MENKTSKPKQEVSKGNLVNKLTRRDVLRGTGKLVLGLCGASLLSGCSNEQPTPKNPITYTGIPRDVVEVKGYWKMGPYTQGFRIEFDDYYAITGEQGLFGQEGWAFKGPKLVPHATVNSFRKIANLCESIKGTEEIALNGDLAKCKNHGEDYLFDGKKVIILYGATYNGQFMEVNRRPLDN